MRLGVYADLVYRQDESGFSTDLAFVLFVARLAERVDELTIFGRLDPVPGRAPYALPAAVRFVPLPHYPSVAALRSLVRSMRGARSAFVAELDRLDAVLIFGPHPISLLFARAARRSGTPVFLGVRQDLPKYIGGRLPGRSWRWAVPVAVGLDRAFRRVARRAPTVAVGAELSRNYSGGNAPVLETGLSLIEAADVVSLEEANGRSWDGELRLISVGRLDPEKNPLLLADVLAGLQARDPRWRLTVVGNGPLEQALRAYAGELGLGDALELVGYVPLGEELWERYRSAHAFLHVSFTEGLPQVLYEAQAAGLTIVATDVGGVRAALGGGERGLLVPPADAGAAVEALERLATDRDLRRRLVEAGLKHAAQETIEAQHDRLLAFVRANL